MTYDRDPQYLHPYLFSRLKNIIAAVETNLPPGYTARLISAYRSPEDQFRLYQQGRTFRNGSWAKTGAVVTNLDGFIKKSRHNYLPATALDLGIFKDNIYITDNTLYKHVKAGIQSGLDWGGNWKGSLIDRPHLEMPSSLFFKNNIDRDAAWIWQNYLAKAKTYSGAMDGYFGALSKKALSDATGEYERNTKAWNKLFTTFGVLEL
jgi:peptidoglycan L-alanyl-D-glutamate endopeptidase CwlK